MLILKKLDEKIKQISLTEKILFYLIVLIFLISSIATLWEFNKYFLVEAPVKGGKLIEGVIGSPRFINPLLATSDVDHDMTSLVFSGLLKIDPEGKLVPDLAKEYTVSKDGLVYTFILNNNLSFHNGKPLNADDVIFTIQKAQDPAIKSPRRANWEGVDLKKINDYEISFTLRQPYYPFLENATLGILPKHLWDNLTPEQFSLSQLNIEPIGSGPYKVAGIKKSSSGIPENYIFNSFNEYVSGEAYISKLIINLYQDEEELFLAYSNGDIDSINSISPDKIQRLKDKEIRIEKSSLPRIFGVFLNQNRAQVFANKEVRMALDEAVDKQKIVNEILKGYGTPIDGPIPPTSKYYLQTTPEDDAKRDRTESAKNILLENGWNLGDDGLMHKKIKNTDTILQFSLATSNTTELKQTAELIKSDWEKLGAKVNLEIFEVGDLNQNIIRPREYDALLFGEIVGRDMDLFAFWHSSQRNNPGLNIAMYTNTITDKLLENNRSIADEKKKRENYYKFQREISKDVPAIFIYSPDFLYIIPKDIKGFSMGNIIAPSERFLNISKWYIKTEKIWKIFIN